MSDNEFSANDPAARQKRDRRNLWIVVALAILILLLPVILLQLRIIVPHK